MAAYFVKNSSMSFDYGKQPKEFRAIYAIENRFFLCESPKSPVGEAVIKIPEEQEENFIFFRYPLGVKSAFDPFGGQVAVTSEPDHKGRVVYRYNEDQISKKISITKWIMLTVWLPDRATMENIPQDQVDSMINEIQNLNTLVELSTYIKTNLYYNL